MRKNKLLLLLVLLLMAATGAWATDYTTLAVGDVIKVGDTFTPTADGVFNDSGVDNGKTYTLMRADIDDDYNVTEKTDGAYYVFKFVSDMLPYIHFEKAFAVTTISDGLEVTNIENMKGMLSYTLAVHEPTPATYSITLDEGTGSKDSQNWEITPKSSELSGGETVTVKYNGSREVKSVTVVKKGAVDNTYLAWDGTQKKLVATEMPATYTTVANADAGVEWQAGTYVVEGDVTINGTITLKGDVNLIIKDGATLTAKHINGFNGNSSSYNLSIYGQANQTGELVINRTDGNAIMDITILEVHSAKVTATSSADSRGGFSYIGEFNVYGGLVDAKNTGSNGCGIYLKEVGYMNIWGGEVKAEGKGDSSYGITSPSITSSDAAYVIVHGGKLWAGNANNSALNHDGIYLTKDTGYTSGKIEYSPNNNDWSEEVDANAKYVRVGY